jgi:hypothetical protein
MVTKPRKPDPDRCEPQRQRLDDLDARIAEIRKELADQDIPPQQRPRLEAELAQLQRRRPQLVRLLEQCEAQAGGTPKKAVAAKKKKTVVKKKKPAATKKKKTAKTKKKR